ncbi:YLP motif-containing protein 1 isoform X2 [Cloeon dipterum]|uniref:YLP motif-containing protein 1 isoform X2 n=1 Tax=Cloeon dipterum TaxID=197152 RepID=UPI00321FC0E0
MDGSSQEWLQWEQDYAQWQAQYGLQYEMMQQNIGQIPHQTNDFGFQPRGGRGGRGGVIRGGRGRGGQQQQWSPGGGPNQRGRGWNNSLPNMRRGGANNTGQWGGNNQQNENSWQKPQSDDSWGNQPQQPQWGAQALKVDNQPQQQFNMRGRGRGGTPRGGGFGKQQELPGPGAAVVVPPPAMLELSRQPPPPPPPQEEPSMPPIPSLMQAIVQQSAVEVKEEMSEAEKEFDLQFKNWEEQFNSWKEENKQHPDRRQYEEYERKMEKFREQLLSRREQMKKKREAETKASQNVTSGNPILNAELAAFTAIWEKGPAEDPKAKVNTIQETLKQMANYRPVTGAMPSSIPGLDVDATVKEETLQPPGTEPVENPKPNVPVKEAPTPPSPPAGFVPPANRFNQGHQANNPLPPGHLSGNQPGPLAGNQPSPTARNQPNLMAGNQCGPITMNQHSPMGGNEPSPMAGNKLGPMAGNQPGNMGRNEFIAMGRNQPGPMGRNQPGPIGRNHPGPIGRNQPGPMARNQPGPPQGAPFHQNNFRQEQNFFEDDFMDDNQEMAAMHERFSEDSNDGRKNGRSEVDNVGTLPPDFNPWIDLDSDEELPPYMYDKSPSKLAPSEKQQWQGSQGNFQDQGPPRRDFGPPSGDFGPPREDFGPPRGDFGPPRGDFGPSRGDFGPNRMDFGPPRGNFGPQGDTGLRPNDQNQRWNEFREHDIDDRGRDRDDRGRDVDDRLLPQGDNRGPFKPYQEEMLRPDQRPGHGGPPLPSRVEEVAEYKAKTVIEYDHKELNVMTPAMTPATPVAANKKKRVFKAPVKIYDYCHSSESEPTIHTPDPFEYDRTQYVKWEEEERRRHERERERERWIQEDRRRYSRHRDWDRAGREKGEKSDSFPDRGIQRSRDRSEHRYREDRPEKPHDRDERENSSESRPERHPSPKQSRNSRSNNSHSSNQESSSKSSGPPQKIFNIPDEAEKSCIEELLCLPGRVQRPSKFAIFMRGLPGSGKSHVAKLIKDKEVENGGNAPRILNLDDYFMVEVETEVQDPETNRKIKSKEMKYEYEAEMEDAYRQSLVKAFRKTIDEGFFPIIVVDCVNDKVKHFEEMWHYASAKGVKTFVAELPEEASVCAARNEHGRTLQQIEQIAAKWEPTPPNFTKLEVKGLLNNTKTAIEVETEEVSDNEDGTEDIEADNQFSTSWMASRSGPPTGRPPQWKIG